MNKSLSRLIYHCIEWYNMSEHNISTKFIDHHEKYLLGYEADADDINFIIKGTDKNIKTTDLFQICEVWARIVTKKKEETLENPKVY